MEWNYINTFLPENKLWKGSVFTNIALIHSNYKLSEVPGITGNQVEFVPKLNFKSGVALGYDKFKSSLQYSFLSDQFSDATNATEGGVSAVVGLIPAYHILDLSLSYEFKKIKLEGSVNNWTNAIYFTRRATGYPGPGILPSDGRGVYLTFQIKI